MAHQLDASLSQTGVPVVAPGGKSGAGEHVGKRLGAFLCWAVVFADIGTSVYYVPGILYGQRDIRDLAGLFVTLTLAAFLLLTLKYAEVSVRFPEGGGVVTVAARGINPWAGAVGGMFILVDYFLTSAISSLSGVQYFETLVPALSPPLVQLIITLVLLVLLGLLNWWGIQESAIVSAFIAVAAFISDMAILVLLFAKVPPRVLGQVFHLIFSGAHLTGPVLLTGFAGAFLAFSGLESISQLSPVMQTPRHKTVVVALALVAITVGVTSPLLTIFSTTLLTHPELLHQTALVAPQVHDLSSLENQFISQLGFSAGGRLLEVLTAVTASTLLIFASNTAIIGAYHVFLALSRMQFFPRFVETRNKARNTPHVSIILATVIPMLVLIAVRGDITILGDMYAFGLLGAFSLTCVALDSIRWRERHHQITATHEDYDEHDGHDAHAAPGTLAASARIATLINARMDPQTIERLRVLRRRVAVQRASLALQAQPATVAIGKGWPNVKYYLGFLTSALVVVAWSVNLVNKPLATAFGGGLTLVGVGIAVVHFRYQRERGEAPAFLLTTLRPIPNAVMVVLTSESKNNLDIARAACLSVAGTNRPLVFLYLAQPSQRQIKPLQFNDPYLYDEEARALLARVSAICARDHVTAEYLYRVSPATVVPRIWRELRPDKLIAEVPFAKSFSKEIAPEYVRFQQLEAVRIAVLSRHQATPGASDVDGRERVAADMRSAERTRSNGPALAATPETRPTPAPATESATQTSDQFHPVTRNGHLKNGYARGTTPPAERRATESPRPAAPEAAPRAGQNGTQHTESPARAPQAASDSGQTTSPTPDTTMSESTATPSRAHADATPPTGTEATPSVDITDYVWTGTELVRRDTLAQRDEDARQRLEHGE